MSWLHKVTDFLWKVRTVLNTDVKDLFKKTIVVDRPVEVLPDLPTPLSRVVKAVRALSPKDIVRKPAEKVSCSHAYTVLKQIWVRVEAKKFELRNEMICAKCKEHKIVPI